MSRTDKPRVTKFLVCQTFDAGSWTDGAALPIANRPLFNNTNAAITAGPTTYQPKALMLQPGQLGIYSAVHDSDVWPYNEAIDATATATTCPAIKLVVGRDSSGDVNPLRPRNYEESPVIKAENGVNFIGEFCTSPANNSVIIGDDIGTTAYVNLADETKYQITIAYDGRRIDHMYGRNNKTTYGSYTTPNYTDMIAAGTLAADTAARDHLLQNLVYNINTYSKVWTTPLSASHDPVVAFAIDSANTLGIAGGGGATGWLISDIVAAAAGDLVTIGYDANGTNVDLTLTASIIETFSQAVTAAIFAGTEAIVPVLIKTPDAGTPAATDVTGGIAAVAGVGGALVDHIYLVALDDEVAFFDRVPQVKVSMRVGLSLGFNSSFVRNAVVTRADEGKGLARQLELLYQSSMDAIEKYDTTFDEDYLNYAYTSDIVAGTTYSVYTIYAEDRGFKSDGGTSIGPVLVYILVPCCDETTKTGIEAVLNPWVLSGPFGRTGGILDGSNNVAVTAC